MTEFDKHRSLRYDNEVPNRVGLTTRMRTVKQYVYSAARSGRLVLSHPEQERPASPAAAAVMAARLVELLARHERLENGRVLLIEPASWALAAGIEALGFAGEQWTLCGASQPADTFDRSGDRSGATWSASAPDRGRQ